MNVAGGDLTEHRRLLFSIAYEILGSVADAEDALQEVFLNWRDVDHAIVVNQRAYLAQMVTRQALTILRTARRRRENYVGPWLPEPIATTTASTPSQVAATDPLEHVLTGEAVTTAMLLVLEALTPTQRAVFVLREVFDFEYAEIAAAVGKSEAAVRQINHRARARVHEGRQVAVPAVPDAGAVAKRFREAAETGDVQALMDVLAPGAVFIADGGGVVSAARRPVHGVSAVARLVIGLFDKGRRLGELGIDLAEHNGMPSIVVTVDGTLDQITTLEIVGDRVTAIYCVRNPSKLHANLRLSTLAPRERQRPRRE